MKSALRMKIGVFDSGQGGLFLIKEIIKTLPQYDYIYLGDTKRVPYGNRSPETIYEFTHNAVEYLFKAECRLVILACNSASAHALKKIQELCITRHYPDRKVLGVLAPAAEMIQNLGIKRVGVLATQATVDSKAFTKEIKKTVGKNAVVYEKAAPLLVPLVESGEMQWADDILSAYVKPLINKKVEAILLGCTHYPIFKNYLRRIIGSNIKIISPDEFIGKSLASYLLRHKKLEKSLGRSGLREFWVTESTSALTKRAKAWFGKTIRLKTVNLEIW